MTTFRSDLSTQGAGRANNPPGYFHASEYGTPPQKRAPASVEGGEQLSPMVARSAMRG